MVRVLRDTVPRPLLRYQVGRAYLTTQFYSGGGDISKGFKHSHGQVDDRDESGIYQWGRMTMKSGRCDYEQGTRRVPDRIYRPLNESDTALSN